MKKKKWLSITSFLVIGAFSLLACSGEMITAPGEEDEGQLTVAEQQHIPTDQINWISWTSEFSKKIRALNKDVIASSLIVASKGGKVGGRSTFENKVEIPANALSEDTEVSVLVRCMDDSDSCVGEVEFLPNMQFNGDVKITLSYEHLEYSGSPNDIKIYWTKSFSDNGWQDIEVLNVDTKAKTLSFYIDHFTRYAWGL